jgi:hypothetical protein
MPFHRGCTGTMRKLLSSSMKILLSERKRPSHTQRESLGSIILIRLVVGMGRAITTLYKRLRKRNRCTSRKVAG